MADADVTVVGNVTRDPELRFTPSGQATLSFGLAVNRRWQNRQTQEWEEAVSFFEVVAWRDLAEHVAESVTRGTRVVVTGRLEQRSWETPEGDKRSRVEIIADDIGPSLRFATAVVHRIAREQDEQGGARPASRPASSAPRPAAPAPAPAPAPVPASVGAGGSSFEADDDEF
ncbi:MAG: single-stranded DNA-binding protein [Acidimicrobiales bacterium]